MSSNDRDIFGIDLNNLEKEWQHQPVLFQKYSRKLADARRDYEEVKRELEVVEAETDLSVRKNPDLYELPEKLTEKMISNTVHLDTKYRIAQTNIIVSKHKVDVLQGFVTSLDHRKKALENEVTLFGQSYFSCPVVAEVGKKGKEKLNEKMVQDRIKRRKKRRAER